jgi:N-acetylglutamate synthase-like GNAT family acetyltransferase
MTEIRTIRESESEPFLGLLCRVFDLDIVRARNIFYNEPMFDLERKWAVFENGEPISILTTVGLEFGWGKAIGIAGVATRQDRRGHGLARVLLEAVLQNALDHGVSAAYLFARDSRVYEKVGFETIDEAVYAPIHGRPEYILPRTLSQDEVRSVYDRWACENPNRLLRDERRWNYWKWNLRVCTVHSSGYLCLEGSLVREVVPGGGTPPWPLPAGTEWFGLRSMAKEIQAPIRDPRPELMLMGWRSPGMPQFFMTDQF